MVNNKNNILSDSNLLTQGSAKGGEMSGKPIAKNLVTNTENFESTKKIVVKDNNWINACAVPTKMKSNIISTENEIDNEFEESFRVKSQKNSNLNKNNQIIYSIPANSHPQSVHDELTKSK